MELRQLIRASATSSLWSNMQNYCSCALNIRTKCKAKYDLFLLWDISHTEQDEVTFRNSSG